MSYEITSQDIKIKLYPIRYCRSRREESNLLDETLERLLLGTPGFPTLLYQSLTSMFQVDVSSIYPHFKPRSETSLIEEFYGEISREETLEHDIIVRLAPIREYTVRVKIKDVEKATPRIVEPEGF